MSDRGRSPEWEAVVEAEERFAQALAAIPRDDLGPILSLALADFSSRRAALRVLAGGTPELISEVLSAVEPLLLISHSLLQECRRLITRLPREQMLDYLGSLTRKVVHDTAADYEQYRRLAELLRSGEAQDLLDVLVRSALQSSDPDIHEVGEDFA